MNIPVNKSEFFYPSADAITQIHALKWIPSEKIKAIVQIAHGMSEHIERYNEFAEYLASNGYIVCGNDHLGHGQSVLSPDKYGYFSKENGWQNLIEDMHTLNKMIKEDYSELPYIILGHSMGSFLAREYTALYGDELTAAIYTGTSGGSMFINLAIKSCQKQIEEKGELVKAVDIDKLAFGKYNKRAYPRHSDYDWLSRDTDEVNKYIADPLCGIIFTYGGFLDLFNLLKQVSGKKWAVRIPAELPIYIFSGNMDPVGNYSHGVVKVADWLTSTSHRDVTVKFYEDGRHEMLNDINKKFVYKDTLKWLDKTLKSIQEKAKEEKNSEEETKSNKKLNKIKNKFKNS